jgi:hypothetical protein
MIDYDGKHFFEDRYKTPRTNVLIFLIYNNVPVSENGLGYPIIQNESYKEDKGDKYEVVII